jgi:hypothetical protein
MQEAGHQKQAPEATQEQLPSRSILNLTDS